jgi:predicted TIM-barrel fold metal-dependent hydrolase
LVRTYQVISADGHIETPPDVWVKYVPEKWKERAPRLITLPEGGEGWVVEGQPMLHNGQNISGGKPMIKFRGDTYFNEDGSPAPGAGPAAQRLREQDQDGLDCEVLFPPVFATRFLTGIADKGAYLSMIQAYNTWLAQDYCAVAPDRLIGNGVIPISGIDDAVNELKRCKELGLRSVVLHEFPNGSGQPKPEDDRFWETALSLDMPISPHQAIGPRTNPPINVGAGTGGQDFAGALYSRTGGASPIYMLAQIIASGLLDRFPELEFYVAETNAGWMPEALFMLDDNYTIFKPWFGVTLKQLPSEYVKERFYFGIIRDPLAIQLREHLPADRLMWGSDFPHSVGSFPKSREWLDIIFQGAPQDLKRKVLLENPAKFYGLDLNKPITATPPV